jgi:hypothetical protein
MPGDTTESGANQLLSAAGRSRVVDLGLIALSLLRWPATALLLAPGFELAEYRWVLIPAVQAGAEAMFWLGVRLVGPLGAALARIAGRWRVRATPERTLRIFSLVQTLLRRGPETGTPTERGAYSGCFADPAGSCGRWLTTRNFPMYSAATRGVSPG